MTCAAVARNDAKVLVLSTPKLKESAQNIVALCPDRLEYLEVEMSHFSSMVPSTRLPVEKLTGRDVVLVCDIRFDYFLNFLALVYEIPRYGVRTFHVYITTFLCATMERVSDGELGSARTFARCISGIPSPVLGQTQVALFDPHAPASRFFFDDRIGISFLSVVPLVFKPFMRQVFAEYKKPLLAFPDEGAFKRFKPLIPESEADRIIFSKQRIGDQRILNCTEGSDFVTDGRPVILLDDIVMSGGTLRTCANRLSELGAKEIHCFCVHAVFPEKAHLKMVPAARKAAGEAEFKSFITTNTVPTVTSELQEWNAENKIEFFQVLDIAPVIVDSLGFATKKATSQCE